MHVFLFLFFSLNFLIPSVTNFSSEGSLTSITISPSSNALIKTTENVQIISQDQIKNSSALDLASLINEFSNAFVNDTGSNGKNYSVDFMGFGETAGANVLVLLNGVKLNESDLSGVEWLQVPISNIEKIEILKSSKYSVLYGDNAEGGVINIITKEGKSFSTGASISGGSFKTINNSLYFQKGFEDFSTGLFVNSSRTDGYRDNSNLKKSNINYNLKFYDDNYSVLFETFYHNDEFGLPGAIYKSEFDSGTYKRTSAKNVSDFGSSNSYIIRIKPEINLNKNVKFSIDTSLRERDSYANYVSSSFESSTENKTSIIKPRLEYFSDNNTFISGIDYQDANVYGTTRMQRQIFDLYFYDKYSLTKNFIFDAGYRYSEANYHYSNTDGLKSISSYTLGGAYYFTKETNVYLNTSRSFRYPLIDEYYNLFTNSINEDLKEQSSVNVELGTNIKINKCFSSNLDIFYKNTQDEIFYDPYTYENTNLEGKTERLGLDLNLNYKNKFLVSSIYYSYLYNYIRSGDFQGKNIPNVPENKAGFNLTFKPIKDLFICFSGKYIGKRYFVSDFNNSFEKQADYFVLNSKIKYLYKKLTFFLNINNLTDIKYDYGVIGFNMSSFQNERAYYPASGFNFLTGLMFDIN